MYLCTRNYDLKRGGTFETAKAGTFHSVTAGTLIPLSPNEYYKDSKTEHQIALMTMLDISVQPFINYWSKDEEKVTIELSVFDEMLTVTVNEKEQKLYEDAAHFITKRYSWYYKTYEKIKSEPEISRMALVDICIEKFYSPTPDDTSEEKS